MEQIFANLHDIGIATTVISLISIFLTGCLKLIPAIKNIKEGWRKAVYQGINVFFTAALSVGYHLLIAKGWWDMDMLRFTLIVLAEVNVLYPLYENLGLRALLRMIAKAIVTPRKAKQQIEEDKAEAEAEKLEGTEAPVVEETVQENDNQPNENDWLA